MVRFLESIKIINKVNEYLTIEEIITYYYTTILQQNPLISNVFCLTIFKKLLISQRMISFSKFKRYPVEHINLVTLETNMISLNKIMRITYKIDSVCKIIKTKKNGDRCILEHQKFLNSIVDSNQKQIFIIFKHKSYNNIDELFNRCKLLISYFGMKFMYQVTKNSKYEEVLYYLERIHKPPTFDYDLMYGFFKHSIKSIQKLFSNIDLLIKQKQNIIQTVINMNEENIQKLKDSTTKHAAKQKLLH